MNKNSYFILDFSTCILHSEFETKYLNPCVIVVENKHPCADLAVLFFRYGISLSLCQIWLLDLAGFSRVEDSSTIVKIDNDSV